MKKVSKLMEHLEEELLLEIQEESMDELKCQRIKNSVLSNITSEEIGTVNKDTYRKKSLMSKHKVYKKILILAGVLVALFGGLVGAISVSETIQNLFGENIGLVAPEAQTIQQSISKHGITVTLDTAIVDNVGGIIIFNFTRDDGQKFPQGVTSRYVDIEFDEPRSRATGEQYVLSEDGKQLTYILSLKASDGVTDGGITTKFSDLVIATPKETITPIDLDEMHALMQVDVGAEVDQPDEDGVAKIFTAKDHAKEEIRQSLDHPYLDVDIIGVGFRAADFFIETENLKPDEFMGDLFKLIDTRTGEEISTNSSEYGNSQEEGNDKVIEYKKTYYPGIYPDDLPYIQLVNIYNEYEYIVEGEWELAFELEQNRRVKKSSKTKTIEYKDSQMSVDYVEISFISGVIKGSVVDKDTKEAWKLPHIDLPIQVVMKDGTKIPYSHSMSTSDEEGFRLSIRPDISHEGGMDEIEMIEKTVIDTNQVKGIEINGQYIRLR